MLFRLLPLFCCILAMQAATVEEHGDFLWIRDLGDAFDEQQYLIRTEAIQSVAHRKEGGRWTVTIATDELAPDDQGLVCNRSIELRFDTAGAAAGLMQALVAHL